MHTAAQEAELIDRIYECAVVPELWPQVLDDVAKMTDSRGGLLFSARKSLYWTASETVRDVFAEYVSDGWFTRCSRRVCLYSRSEPSFFVEQDFWTEEELAANPIYRDFFRPRGLGWSAGTGLSVPTGDNIVFSVEREYGGGPIQPEQVAWLNSLRPHLARSAFVTARLRLQRAQGASEALTALQLPALLLDSAGTVIEANPMIDDLRDLLIHGANGRLLLADKRANDMLHGALAAIDDAPEIATNSFPVRDKHGKAVLVAHMIPIKRSAHDILGTSYALLMLTPVAAERRPSTDLVKSLFDLTPSEARIADGLVVGKTLEEIAEAGDVALSTVRSQLRRVLEKTGCTRQAEVAALLANLAIGPGGQA
ncbi:helix-turn-helix transcriptional regulator [Sphingomonas sp. AOB5]|uniref:helix-turn-helix transcriptional regulator n=1 Tax=Sphingomonas sp. AOB5 TaxID=3034017 RepID=UPI0023F78BF2|nr:helix-turn-helix transcriptional regulator [Sphingomonas sp. AOB5]MDF7775273.1 helix-turn-helix transcriptional regulator [Sphingomonas sp. AOB5]